MRVLVAGTMEFEPDAIDQAVLTARPHIDGAYTEKGCVHYAWTKDLLNPGRLYVYEEWDEIADLDVHLKDHWYTDMGGHIREHGLKGADVKKYRVNLKEPVYDAADGVAKANFFTPGADAGTGNERIIVAGILKFAPEAVEKMLLDAKPHIEGAYTEKGCVHYAWTQDLLNPGQVYVLEEWDTIGDLDVHLKDHWYTDMAGHLASSGLQGADVNKYRIDKHEPVYDETGVARAEFFT